MCIRDREVLDRAGSVMEALPSVRQCSESPSRASLPSVVRRAEVRRRLGMLREASALVEGAPEGETLPELSWVRAQIALDRGDLVDARRSFEAVAFAAQAASDHLGSQRAMAERLALACSPTERTMWRGLLQAQESMHPDATPALREVQWAMAQALACEGDRAAAGRLHEAVARALEGQTSAESAAAALASARARLEQGDLIGAEAAAQRAVSTYQAVHGERHPDTLAAQLAVAEARLAGASWQSAEPIIDQVAAATTAAAAAREEADAVRARAWLLRARLSALRARAESPQDALAARTQGAVRAIDPLRKAVAEYEAALGGAHPALAAAALELADALLEAARFDEAEASYRQVAGILESLGQASSPQLARARVGVALAQWGEFPPAGAREILRWGVAPVGAELEPSVEAWAFAALARRLAARGEPARAEDSFRRALTAAQLLGAGAVQSQVAAELASFAVARELPDAVALIERALELSPGAAAERPHLLATLARQLWPKDRERATMLVAEAVASFGAGSAEAEELLRWTRRQRDRR